MSFNSTVISCGQHLSCCVWQLDLSMELRKLTSTASLSSYRRSCPEQHRTSLTSTLHRVWTIIAIYCLPWLADILLQCMWFVHYSEDLYILVMLRYHFFQFRYDINTILTECRSIASEEAEIYRLNINATEITLWRNVLSRGYMWNKIILK